MLIALAVAGALMRLPYFSVGPMLEDDHFRFVLDGAVTVGGMNPYTYAPKAILLGDVPAAYSSIAASGRFAIEHVNFPDLRTMYPGTAQLLFALAHLIKPWSVDGLRVVIFLSELVTAALVLRLLGARNLPHHLVALVWCNPLLAFSLTGQAHIDAAVGPLVLLAVIAVLTSHGAIAGLLIGAGVGIKLWPVMLTPILLRALGNNRTAQVRFLVALGVVSLLVCAPLAVASLSPQSGLVAYASRWHMNNMPYEWVSYAGYLLVGGDGLERYLRMIVGLVSAAISVRLAVRPVADAGDLVARLALVSACVFYLSPAQFPWYAVWFLPLATLARNWSLLAASAALPSYFLFFPMAGPVHGDLYRFWLSGLHLVPVIWVALAVRSKHRPGAA